jgi:hypothetical protein
MKRGGWLGERMGWEEDAVKGHQRHHDHHQDQADLNQPFAP